MTRAPCLGCSLYSDKYCFALNCCQTCLFTEVEWAVYNDNHTWTMRENPGVVSMDRFVYLRTTATDVSRPHQATW